jgi:glycosyltransferase involved in cell wall biosynthesis
LIGEIRDRKILEMMSEPAIAARVHGIGFRCDAAALVGLAHAFVMPSIEREGLPRAVIEAMSQSIPVVVSDVGGMPEMVEDGVSGLVVPPSNPVALREALSKLEASPELRTTLGAAGRKRIVGTFNISDTIDRMEQLFESVAKR